MADNNRKYISIINKGGDDIYIKDVEAREAISQISGTGKADKVTGATAGDYAALDSSGNLTDSGYSPSDHPTFTETASQVSALDATLVTDALRKTAQTLTSAEKAQVRTNLGLDSLYLSTNAASSFVSTGQQTLTSAELAQIRTNLGLDSVYLPQSAADDYLLKGQQTLTSAEIAQIKENLGLDSSYLKTGTQNLSSVQKAQVKANLDITDAQLAGNATGPIIAQSNTSYTTAQVRNIVLSTSEPTSSDGNNGDIWIVYEA
jgi:hypothetical protein